MCKKRTESKYTEWIHEKKKTKQNKNEQVST